ncbi:MAG: DMT family transporter [Proteobacteria bacterium]|nr:DMT family transporter [Pseudomonadota bacterium]MBU1611648.1 DMT family transporter [Pseudomonadota bacterium]
MKTAILRADALLLLTALIWGTAFVFQKTGMEHLGPYGFNGVRFILGSLALTPLTLLTLRKSAAAPYDNRPGPMTYLKGGLLAGCALFGGAALQQVGIVTTSAGNAGFITGLYVILTPMMGLFFRQRPGWGTWLGGVLAVIGLFFLCITGDLTIAHGDLMVLFSAFFWAAHLLVIGWLAPKMNPIALAQAQFMVCGLLSLGTGLAIETISWEGILGARNSILYCGLMSTGVAYTLQVVAQREANPAHASIILSLEAVFAAVAGWLLLGELLGTQALFGCALMLTGMIISQLKP